MTGRLHEEDAARELGGTCVDAQTGEPDLSPVT